jgi:hypothetical protein
VPSNSTKSAGWYLDLLLATAHTVAWGPFAATTAVSLILAAVQQWTSNRTDAVLTHFVIVIIAGATASVIDDEAATTLTTSTTVYRRRLLFRTALGVTAGATCLLAFTATLHAANASTAHGDLLNLLPLWASLTALTIGIGTVATRLFPDTSAALVGSGALLSGAILTSATPSIQVASNFSQLALWNEPGERALLVIAASFTVFLWASPDPGSQ